LSAPLLFGPCGRVEIAFAQQPETPNRLEGEKDACPLEAGKPIEREMAGGQKRYYAITLEAGQYSQLVVDQKGIDLVVTLFDPAGKKLIEVDSLVGAYRPERVSIIADTSGSTGRNRRRPKKAPAPDQTQVKFPKKAMPPPKIKFL
jgi:hypothetical protein